MESEFIALELAGQEAEWLRKRCAVVGVNCAGIPALRFPSCHWDCQKLCLQWENDAHSHQTWSSKRATKWNNLLGLCQVREELGRSSHKRTHQENYI
ncbi:UNVERIFIED_CONTAM: hypothetical protein Sradi_3589900 [Sesamum radiatum]|uniref:Uncharacterized protein n=1 Tax=Sesamum radiatum TaxID=300843 RepID=A0AAW2QIE7_SESRA